MHSWKALCERVFPIDPQKILFFGLLGFSLTHDSNSPKPRNLAPEHSVLAAATPRRGAVFGRSSTLHDPDLTREGLIGSVSCGNTLTRRSSKSRGSSCTVAVTKKCCF